MSIRRFVAASAREALRQAREALGEDVMILANRQVDGGVEVLALNETGLAELESGVAQAAAGGTAGRRGGDVGSGSGPGGARPGQSATEAGVGLNREVMQALGALRGAMESRIDGLLWGERLKRAPVGVTVYRTLLGAGFSAALARALTERLPAELDREAALAWAQQELTRKLPIQADEDKLWGDGGVFALVGPTGVGKTTTTAKLAARCVLKFGAENVAMLTTDGYRIGAHEQLLIYGRILGVPVLPAGDAAALRQALSELGARRVILMDTVGMSQRDRQVAEQAAMLCGAGREVRRLLVLNAASHGDTLDEVAHAYRQDNLGAPLGCIVSKVDEATHLGAVLDTAIRHRLPLHYVSNGQKVPENLLSPNAAKLVDRALAIATARSLFAPSDADFAVMQSVQAEARATPSPAPATGAANPGLSTRLAARYRRHLRTAVAASAARGDPAAFDHALDELESVRSFVVAQQLWRHYVAGDTDPALATDTVLADIKAHLSQTCRSHVLAWHAPARAGRLAPTVLLSDQGPALGVAACHLPTPQGVLTTWADRPSLPPAHADTALVRAAWLAETLPDAALIHAYEGVSLNGMKDLLGSGQPWMVRCGDHQRVLYDDHSLTVKGLAGSLGYLPTGVGELPGTTLWTAQAEVKLPLRGAQSSLHDSGLRLLVTRVMETHSGRCLQQAYWLLAVPAAVDQTTLGRWALALQACRGLRPYLEVSEQRLALAAEPNEAIMARMLPAAQLGLSAWQARRQPEAALSIVLGLNAAVSQRPEPVVEALMRLLSALELSRENAVSQEGSV